MHIKLIKEHFGAVPLVSVKPSDVKGWTSKQRPYVATTEQVGALYLEVPDGIKPTILPGAHAGLRLAEAAALRPGDVDFMRGIVSPEIQWPADELKSDTSKTSTPILNELSAAVKRGKGKAIATGEGCPKLATPPSSCPERASSWLTARPSQLPASSTSSPTTTEPLFTLTSSR